MYPGCPQTWMQQRKALNCFCLYLHFKCCSQRSSRLHLPSTGTTVVCHGLTLFVWVLWMKLVSTSWPRKQSLQNSVTTLCFEFLLQHADVFVVASITFEQYSHTLYYMPDQVRRAFHAVWDTFESMGHDLVNAETQVRMPPLGPEQAKNPRNFLSFLQGPKLM